MEGYAQDKNQHAAKTISEREIVARKPRSMTNK
jgi:hypothetical protein